MRNAMTPEQQRRSSSDSGNSSGMLCCYDVTAAVKSAAECSANKQRLRRHSCRGASVEAVSSEKTEMAKDLTRKRKKIVK